MSELAFSAEGLIGGRHVGEGVGKPPKRAERGRICAVEACGTRLDPYNLDDVCWLHRHHGEAQDG